jgi:GNAT superfamily N-acetyltransferase/2'-5' RNA ligase
VDGLRRALGDASLATIAPHVTLVPPVNVAESDLGAAIGALRWAAAGQEGPLALALGPVATFYPLSPVVYLAVGPAGANDRSHLEALAQLHRHVLSGPLARPLRWPWVPHVTVLDEAPAAKIEAAVGALGSYRAEAVFDRVVMLEERDHLWRPVADAVLGRPAVVGRGGLDLEITEGRIAGPDVVAMLDEAGQLSTLATCEAGLGAVTASGPVGAVVTSEPTVSAPASLPAVAAKRAAETLVLTGRREGAVAGVAVGWLACGATPAVHAGVVVSPRERGIGVGRALLRALEAAVRRRGWPPGPVAGHGPASFYEHCGAWAKGGHVDGHGERRPGGGGRRRPSVGEHELARRGDDEVEQRDGSYQ